jgi:protein ImuB
MERGEKRMSQELYACVHAREFPAQALLRLRPDLSSEPVAVVDGNPPLEWVCALNTHAHRRGVVLRMTRTEAEPITGLRLLRRSLKSEASARTVLLECAANFSPRVEDLSSGTSGTCVLDITGTERLFGPPDALARRIRAALKTAGIHTAVAVSANFHTARILAAASRGILVIPAGDEAQSLRALDVESLELAEEHRETLALWGIRTLGEFAALPETELIARLGQRARDWRLLSLGVHPHAFQPVEQAFELSEFAEFDTPLDQVESLLFLAARMIDCLVERASRLALALASLTVQMKLEGAEVHTSIIRPALPSIDRRFLLKLLQLEIGSRPPRAAVIALTLSAEAGQSSKVQLGLFAPETPEPSRLDITLARLKALAGEDRVGSPVLEDSHRPGSFRLEQFTVGQKSDTSSPPAHPRLALRRVRPPKPLRVTLDGERPVAFRDSEDRYEVTAACGPWRSSGCWWALDGWNREEWDVQALSSQGNAVACLVVRDAARGSWHLEAFYD